MVNVKKGVGIFFITALFKSVSIVIRQLNVEFSHPSIVIKLYKFFQYLNLDKIATTSHECCTAPKQAKLSAQTVVGQGNMPRKV